MMSSLFSTILLLNMRNVLFVLVENENICLYVIIFKNFISIGFNRYFFVVVERLADSYIVVFLPSTFVIKIF